IMTMVLITSSGTMAMAVNYGYRRDRFRTTALMLFTAGFGAVFVGMQAFEWTKLILEGVRPWENPFGAEQFGAAFFMITGFHGMHVSIGVIYLVVVALRVLRGDYERAGGNYEIVEIAGLYWHFVVLGWVFIFAFFSLWCRSSTMATVEEVHEATAPAAHEPETADAHGQQHPIKIYILIWGLLFLFSAFSYLTDFLEDGL